jgi:tetratricopeptide (TPR) repeat protein
MAAALDNLTSRLLSSLPEGAPAGEEAKTMLLQALGGDISESEYRKMVGEIASFYIKTGRNDIAIAFTQAIEEFIDDFEEQVDWYLVFGQLAEQRQEFDVACNYYTKGLTLRPASKAVSYFLHNNLAYCLNLRGEHAEAERLCRTAIEIDSRRANAFKNLGIALAGQNDVIGAAWAWIEAIKANPDDTRSLMLLEQLVAEHPEIARRLAGSWQEVEAYRELLRPTPPESGSASAHEVCRLRHIPGKGYFQLRDGVEKTTSAEEIEGLYSEQALEMLGQYPGTWCVIVSDSAANVSRAENEDANPETSVPVGNLAPALLLRGHARH